jgi:DNA polymerase-3 subunit delta'
VIIIGHKKQWEFLKKKSESNELSHAYLFTGADGIGKKTFAKEFIKFVNCADKKIAPCQKCFSCQAIERGSFPDLMLVNPEDGREIPILKIRDVQNFLSYKSYYGSFKSVVVDGAEKMNQEAQSCFLKTLEEPKGKTLLILISSKPDIFLPTIISRCQTMKFFKPKDLPQNSERTEKEKIILKDLLSVISSDFAEKFKYTKSLDFEKQNINAILEVLQKYLRHLLLVKTGIDKADARDAFFSGYPVSSIKKAISLTEEINNKLIFTNANPRLALEILLMEI